MSEAGLGSESNSTPPPHHGVKRRGDDNTQEQRLSKRFNLLNIGKRNSHLWTSPSENTRSVTTQSSSHGDPSSSMQVDETKDRIYIHDLEEELRLADEIPNEDRVIFLPDIDKKLNEIPKQILQANDHPPATGNELVLYSVPSSLSVSQENDSVKRAILESRARASDKAKNDALQQKSDSKLSNDSHQVAAREISHEAHDCADEDAMEIE